MPHTPINARGFHTHGKEFFAAAEAVAAARKPAVLPLAFLWGRTIELLLKSYLLAVGLPSHELKSRKFGHNLVALFSECEARGIAPLIGTESHVAVILQAINLEYATKRFEYRESGTTYTIPDANMTRVVIKRLINGINFHLKSIGI